MPTTLICMEPLPDGKVWESRDRYEIGGMGIARMGVSFDLKPNDSAKTYNLSDFANPNTMTATLGSPEARGFSMRGRCLHQALHDG